ncbi:hypothetical protein BJV77DRAFT_729994 [Russula vinacea]|nr:hypothetical protein BJV77DRAFT_729994 [Russula vinacea]
MKLPISRSGQASRQASRHSGGQYRTPHSLRQVDQYKMVNFQDPAVVYNELLALMKFWLVVDGIFLWDFITTLDFEWSIIQGRRRYRWTIWIYSLSRMAALANVINNLILFNLNTPFNCQLAETLAFALAYLALSAASFLLVLRIVAIWKRNVIATGIAATIWVNNGAFFIRGISRVRYERVFLGNYCHPLNVQDFKVSMIIAFLTDIFLLIIMLVGLFRLDCHRPGALATGRFLWNQGVIWLLLAIVAGIVPTVSPASFSYMFLLFSLDAKVFACLDLNDPLTMIFLFPWEITMTIAASRMYRGLDDFLSSDVSHVPYKSGRRISDSGTRGTSTMPIPPNGIAVNVHTHSLTSHAIRPSLGSDMDGQPHEKPHESV